MALATFTTIVSVLLMTCTLLLLPALQRISALAQAASLAFTMLKLMVSFTMRGSSLLKKTAGQEIFVKRGCSWLYTSAMVSLIFTKSAAGH